MRAVMLLAAAGACAACSGPASGAADASSALADAASGSPDAGAVSYLPWEGGPSYYAKWAHGPSPAEDFFPIAVWLQSPANAAAYQAIGINTYVGLWDGPTDQQLEDLKAAGMPAICAQEVDWASHEDDATVVGWMHGDEPDNAQPDGNGGYLPCVEPKVIQDGYAAMVASDATRPVYLNLGQGVAWPDWYGRGTCTGKTEMYAEYAKGADILSFDIYPVNSGDAAVKGNLWMVADGVDRLRQAAGYQKPVWAWIECTGINGPAGKPTPAQVKAEIWMALVHGARGYGFFSHVFAPSFIEAGLLADAQMKDAVEAINAQVKSLAEVLNTPSIAGATVESSNPDVPVDFMVKQVRGEAWVFAVAMRPGTTKATFKLPGMPARIGLVEVVGEGQVHMSSNDTFSDDFTSDYAVRLYHVCYP